METSLSVKQLSRSSVTRARGHEAYRELRKQLANGPVEVDLRGEELLSISFLDEIVLRLLESSQLDRVTFLTADPTMLRRLGRVASIRKAPILFRSERGKPKKQVPCQAAPNLEVKGTSKPSVVSPK